MKRLIRRLVPKKIFAIYHTLLARSGAVVYGHPSRRMTVIGVTGTTGKSSVVEMLSAIFRASGNIVGSSSTVQFRVGDRTWLNNEKMTMLGRWKLQRLLRDMVNAGCNIAIVETTSEGISQGRHLGIEYDTVVFTNLTPEHIESHGSFDAYRRAKGKLFQQLTKTFRKPNTPKISVVNLDSAEAKFFLQFPADKKAGFTLNDPALPEDIETVFAKNIRNEALQSRFQIAETEMTVPLPGAYNVVNALTAATTAIAMGVDLPTIQRGLAGVKGVPGRFELIQQEPFSVIVDYAHEPAGLEAVYKSVRSMNPKRVIAVLGAAGGGRDKGKRPTLGTLAAQYADIVIVTNEDPYDEDPQSIIDQVVAGSIQSGKKEGETLFQILDRRDALAKAIQLAQPGDVVIVTGKGSEQSMVVAGGRKVPWSDAKILKEILRSRMGSRSTSV